MIATIVPLRRLPRSFSVCDYLVPDTLRESIAIGQLVHIPLRSTREFGIVVNLSATLDPTFGYKEIESIAHITPLVPAYTMHFLASLALQYAVSLSTLYKTSLLPIQKRKITKISLSPLLQPQIHDTSPSPTYVLYHNEDEYMSILQNISPDNVTLFLVPEVQDIPSVQTILNTLALPIYVWHSELTIKQKFDTWLAIRNEIHPHIVIGTRSAVTLPFTTLDTIIMDREHSDQYKNYEQQPRYHTKDVVQTLARIHGAALVYADFSPSCESYYHIAKKHFPTTIGTQPYTDGLVFATQQSTHKQPLRLIEHTHTPRTPRICADSTEQTILDKLEQDKSDVAVILERKGYATAVVCKECGHIERSHNTGLPMVYRASTNRLYAPYTKESRPMPTTCDTCTSHMITLSGIGTEQVESYFRDILTTHHIDADIIRIDDHTVGVDTQKGNKKPTLYIGTTKLLSHTTPTSISLYALLDAGRTLSLPEYTAPARLRHLIDEIEYIRLPTSDFIIETTSLETPFFTSLGQKDRFYRTELNMRQKLGYPPYQTMIKYVCGALRATDALHRATRLSHDISRRLTKHTLPATVSDPYDTHPNFAKRMYWYGILLQADPAHIDAIIQAIHPALPHGCIVDINPISILSP